MTAWGGRPPFAGPGGAARSHSSAADRAIQACGGVPGSRQPHGTRNSTATPAVRPSRSSGRSRSRARVPRRRRGRCVREPRRRRRALALARLPQRPACRTGHTVELELIQNGGAARRAELPLLHVVGRATFRAGAPLAAYFGAGGGKRPPILSADGVVPFDARRFRRRADLAHVRWIVPVAPRSIHDGSSRSLGTRLDRAQSKLEQKSDIFHAHSATGTIASIRATSASPGSGC